MEEQFRVLLADDHLVVRRGLKAVIEGMPGWSVCGEATDGRQALRLAEELRPNVVVMDLSMPDLNGIDATRQIRKISPDTEVLVFTGQESEELVQQVFAAGARSYLLKTSGKDELETALRALARHKPYFSTEVGEILFAKYLKENKGEDGGEGEGRLSPREREIVQSLSEGKSNKEVADALGISVKTVETHRAAVMKKLKLKAFSELVRYAVRNHLVSA